jgi:hypothetical protein
MDSNAQVRREIQEHYESALEAAISGGSSAKDADQLAMAALGDAKLASRQYRRVLLTSAEARVLRDSNREARFVCSRLRLRPALLAISLAALLAAIGTLLTGFADVACAFLVVAMGTGFLFAAPILPVHKPLRARIFRCLKWLVLLSALGFVHGPNTLKCSCLGPLVLSEWTRFSIRRKLPVSQWPRHLYL